MFARLNKSLVQCAVLVATLGLASVTVAESPKPHATSRTKTATPAGKKRKKPTVKLGQVIARQYDFKAAKKKMSYAVYLPSYYTADIEWPLMVVLHGLYSSPNQIMRYPGLTKLAEKYGYVLVAPMGYNNRGWYGAPQPIGKPNPKNLGELSEKDVMNVLAITRADFRINARRIYLMGHSMGGAGTFHLGIKYSHIWAGLAPVAPAIFRDVNDLKDIPNMPVIMVQGDKDRLVPPAIARLWASKMKAMRMDHRYIEVKGGDHVRVGWDYLPQIFDFLDRKQRPATKKQIKPLVEEQKKTQPKTGNAEPATAGDRKPRGTQLHLESH